MINFSPFIWILLRIVLWSSIMTIFLNFIILWSLKIWYLFLSTIILGGTGFFPRTSTSVCIIFTRSLWFMIYKHTQKISNKNIVRNKLDASNTFDLTYYWTYCGKKCLYQLVTYLIQFRTCYNNLNFIIIDRWYFTRLITIIARVPCIIIYIFLSL